MRFRLFGLRFGAGNGALSLRDLLVLRFNARLEFIKAGIIFGALFGKFFDLVANGLDLLFDARPFRLPRGQRILRIAKLQLGFVGFALHAGNIRFGGLIAFARKMQLVHRVFLVRHDGCLLGGERTAAFFEHGEVTAERLALGVQFGGFAVPFIQMRTQSRKTFAEGVVLRLCLLMSLACFVHADFLPAHGFARVGQVALSAMPVKAIPLAQDDFQVRLGAGKFDGAFRLPFQTADARLKFGHNVEHAFEVAFGVFQAFERIVTTGAVQAHPGSFFKETAAVIRFEGERSIHQALTEDGVGALAQTRLSEQFVHLAQADLLVVDDVFVVTVTVGDARHRDFREIKRQPLIGVVEVDGGLRHACARAVLGTGEDHVFGLLTAQQGIGLFAQHPAQRVGDVRFSRTVRSDNGSHTRGKLKGCARGEGFVSLQFE